MGISERLLSKSDTDTDTVYLFIFIFTRTHFYVLFLLAFWKSFGPFEFCFYFLFFFALFSLVSKFCELLGCLFKMDLKGKKIPKYFWRYPRKSLEARYFGLYIG